MKAITRLYVALIACFISSDVLAQPPPTMILMTEKNGGGDHWFMRYSFPTLPSAIDAKAQSVSVIRPPVALYEQPHYGGQALVIARAGGCDDLATCVPSAGNWSNRIRSVRFLRSDDPLLQQSQTLSDPVRPLKLQ
jgi:hypothetical protein